MLFYIPEITGGRIFLPEEESIHAVRVLRLKAEDEIALTDGKGNLCRAHVVIPHAGKCEVEITEIRHCEKHPYKLHIAIAPTKNADRFEWFVEKSVEIGIDEITPLLCGRSERKRISTERLQRVMVSAMKQSKKAFLPKLNAMTPFEGWLETVREENRFIACCFGEERLSLREKYRAGTDVAVAVGPEGDFSPQEVERALAGGFKAISLGSHPLRTETAGVAVCHSICFMNG
jgi:16S rRNA (uracil1498-N3)-methyltransferase